MNKKTQAYQDVLNKVTLNKMFDAMNQHDMLADGADNELIKQLFFLKTAYERIKNNEQI